MYTYFLFMSVPVCFISSLSPVYTHPQRNKFWPPSSQARSVAFPLLARRVRSPDSVTRTCHARPIKNTHIYPNTRHRFPARSAARACVKRFSSASATSFAFCSFSSRS